MIFDLLVQPVQAGNMIENDIWSTNGVHINSLIIAKPKQMAILDLALDRCRARKDGIFPLVFRIRLGNIKEDRIIYKRAKTGKIYSIKLVDEVSSILREFAPNKTLLGILEYKELGNPQKLVDISTQIRKVIYNHLKKIGALIDSREPNTTYIFRYSYANISKQIGYSKDLIAEALGHEYGNAVTGIYLEHFDMEVVDETNDTIIRKVWAV